jgi:glyoxylase-like metal-dependent hydrolase (beta-lactamase superfamily II)
MDPAAALHTPGHVSNHYCFLLEEEGLLFAGDHIMNGSTVVIIPPGGDMQAYIASLRLLLDYPLQASPRGTAR